jgi:hypothetical protein
VHRLDEPAGSSAGTEAAIELGVDEPRTSSRNAVSSGGALAGASVAGHALGGSGRPRF